jgi:chromosomal replication initiator protein
MTSSTEIVQDVVAEYFRMTREQLLAPCRRRDVAWPRQLAMSLTVELLPLSFPATGAHFGNRHHTTVMHACGQVRRQIAQGGRGAERDLALLRVECLRRLDASREKLHGQEAEHEAA